MSNISEVLVGDDLMDVAREWYLRLEDEVGDDEVLNQFEVWVAAMPSHREAFNSVVDFWLHIDSMPEIKKIRETGSSVLDVIYQEPEENVVVDIGQKKPIKATVFAGQGWHKWAIAATVLIVCSFVVNLYSNYLPEGTYRTDTGEQKTIELADGSTVYLNTHSMFRVEFSDKVRKIHLLEGEARFDVAKDTDRPFIVKTNWGDVRAVGTSFNVYDNEEKIEVLVFEGTVSVDHKKDRNTEAIDFSKPSQTAVMVAYGERVVFFDKNLGVVRAAHEFELSQKNAWRDSKLIFRGQKLSEVIREMSRYTNKKIVIADDSLNEMKLGGVFDIEDFDALIHAIEDAFPVRVIRFTPYIAVIVEA